MEPRAQEMEAVLTAAQEIDMGDKKGYSETRADGFLADGYMNMLRNAASVHCGEQQQQ